MNSNLTCCICEALLPDLGHNPEPVNNGKGRCCDVCNFTVVIPARLKEIEKFYD